MYFSMWNLLFKDENMHASSLNLKFSLNITVSLVSVNLKKSFTINKSVHMWFE